MVPTEASAQALRCFHGEIGPSTIRQGRRTVELSPAGALTFYFDPVAALRSAARLAAAVMDARDLDHANEILHGLGVRTELDYERDALAHSSVVIETTIRSVIERLPDGAPILIRPIRADDKRMLTDGLRRLSDESVQRRFLTPKRSFSRAELRYLTEVDGRDHVALVAEYPAEPVAPPDRGRPLREAAGRPRGRRGGHHRRRRLPGTRHSAPYWASTSRIRRAIGASAASRPRWQRTTCPPTA